MSRDATRTEWWAALNDARPQHQPRSPTLIKPGFAGLVAFETLPELAAELAALLDGRRPVLTRSVASYPGFDSFPAFTVYAEGARGESGGPPGAPYVGTIAVQKSKAEEVEAAVAEAQASRRVAA